MKTIIVTHRQVPEDATVSGYESTQTEAGQQHTPGSRRFMLVPGLPLLLASALFLLSSGCAPTAIDQEPIEATSLLGEPLRRPTLDPSFSEKHTEFFVEAQRRTETNPEDPDGWIWSGRRCAYLGRYQEAIEIYSRAMERFPADARFYRHRGHRYITVRDFELAIVDLSKAAQLTAGSPDQIEPDGLPNARGIPTSTLQTNIQYHLGLAYFLSGEYANARRAYTRGLEAATNPDMRSAMAYWLLLTIWRLNFEPDAEVLLSMIDPDWDIIENEDYHGLLREFAGDGDPLLRLESARSAGGVRFATVGFGVGAWQWHRGEREAALATWRDVIDGGSWASFGYIAAEAELARSASRVDPE